MHPEQPICRRLRVFAIDPLAAAQMGIDFDNEAVLRIPWETLRPGPEGEYIAVVDQSEPGSQRFPGVNLDDPYVLAGDGLTPSDGNPQFHQQMVYAVAMNTISAFERALGRRVQWTPIDERFTRRIVAFPHRELDADACFSKAPRELRFGYFRASPDSPNPGMTVFTCLSQDGLSVSRSDSNGIPPSEIGLPVGWGIQQFGNYYAAGMKSWGFPGEL